LLTSGKFESWLLSGSLQLRSAYAAVLHPSVCRLSVVCMECIVSKWCVLEQKLLSTAYRKSYMRNWLVSNWMTLTFV